MSIQPPPVPPQPAPPDLGNNKAIAAGIAGAVVTIISYVLSLAHITPPPEVLTAAQTLIVTALVYYVPHGK